MEVILSTDWQLEETYFRTLLNPNESIKNESFKRLPGGRYIVIHTPNEIPSGKGHWAGGRMNTLEDVFSFMRGLGAAVSYATAVENEDGTYSVWIEDKD